MKPQTIETIKNPDRRPTNLLESRGAVDPKISENLIRDILTTATAYFSSEEILPITLLHRIIKEAIRVTDDNYGIKAAITWAKGYEFSQALVDSNVRCLRAAGLDFTSMVRQRLKTLSKDRLNHSRVNNLRDDNPERSFLHDLADGMHVPFPEGFHPNGHIVTTGLRKTYVTVHSAVNKMLAEIIDQKLAFLLPKTMALEFINNLHLSNAHWTVKKGKPSGRPISDMTFITGTTLNTSETTAAAAARYGDIHHPTIDRIVNMILTFWQRALDRDPNSKWENLRLWKMDLKGAYTLLSFRPEDVGLFGMEVTGDLVYLQIAGIFGWACTPAAFKVVTRAITWELSHVLQSLVDMYVDDIIGACFDEDLQSDLVIARKVCTDLLGSTAVADDKTEWGRRLDVIGYVVDLDKERVSISQKNFLNTLYGFLTVDLNAPMSLKVAQKLASWSSRYGNICRAMRPFCGALNRLCSGRIDRHATFAVTEEAKQAIRLWRAMLFLVQYDELRFTRPFQSFNGTAIPTLIVEFDASLSGVGILWFKRSNSAEVCLGGSAVDLRFLEFQEDSSFQNLSEFLGIILGIVGLVKLGYSNADIELRGDSISALTWAEAERYRGENITNASMVFTSLCIAFGMNVKIASHIAGVKNERCDELSRVTSSGKSVASIMEKYKLTYAPEVYIGDNAKVQQLLLECDPSLKFPTEKHFLDSWGRIREAISSLKGEHN